MDSTTAESHTCARCFIAFDKEPRCNVDVGFVEEGGMMNGPLCDSCASRLYDWIIDGMYEDMDRREGRTPSPPPDYFKTLALGTFLATNSAEEIRLGLKYHTTHHLTDKAIRSGQLDPDCFFCKMLSEYEIKKNRQSKQTRLF